MRPYRLVIALCAVVALSLCGTAQASAHEGIETSRESSVIAPGLRWTEFERFDPKGWIRGDVLTADLAHSALRPEYLSPEHVAAATPLSEQAGRSDAVAGVNGDFFDIDRTDAPLGVGIDQGRLRHAPAGGHNQVASIGEHAGRLMRVLLDAELTRADGSTMHITDLNPAILAPDGIGLYTPVWGGAPRASVVEGAQRVTEVELSGGVVSGISDAPADGPVPAGAVRLLGVGHGADALATLRPGERVGVDYRPRTDGSVPDVAIGGNKVLLRDGAIEPVDDAETHPRTAVGFSADGTRMWLVTIDGRQSGSRGMTERELAEQLRALGADDALNLDGGGSSTLLAREPGGSAAEVRNSPSDGTQRPVPNGIGFSTAPGSGVLSGFRVETATDSPDGERVLSGLTRRLRAYGHDEMGAPVAAKPAWSVPSGGGRMQGNVFHARRPGAATVEATQDGADGSAELSVLGPLDHLDTDVERLALPKIGARGHFQVFGSDAEGFRTWVEPSDVSLKYDPSLVRITPAGDGFDVTARSAAGSPIEVRVGEETAHFGVTVGSHPQQLSALDDVGGWHTSVQPDPVRATLSRAEGRAETPGLALDYALTGSNETRAAYVNTDAPMRLPDGTQKIGVWVKGDGRGGWLRSTIVDAAGVSTPLDLARNVDWTGWRYVETPIPPGVSGTSRLQRMYVVEPDPQRQYEGRIVFDDLTASVAPRADVPADPQPQDASVVQDGTLPPEAGSTRVAVVSDAQFTADDPDGPLVRQARRSLRDAVAARPDMVVINGDFVDRGTGADMDLARRIIRSELGDRVPWVYVPGNHETYGTGDLREFRSRFGPTHRIVNSGPHRFVFLDSSRGSLRSGGFDQIEMLRHALDTAAGDPTIESVSVFLHHPTEDPTPADASELDDPLEANLLRSWLTDFEDASGKEAVAVTAHAGTFDASTVDGVQYLVNGNSGKAPAVAPEDGGFTGTSLLRIDSGDRTPIRWETRPHVDDLLLRVPGALAPGDTRRVGSVVFQGSRAVPVDYPVSGDWEGSPAIHIGPADEAGAGQVAAFDPETGKLTGLRPGRGVLSLSVNGTTRKADVAVTP